MQVGRESENVFIVVPGTYVLKISCCVHSGREHTVRPITIVLKRLRECKHRQMATIVPGFTAFLTPPEGSWGGGCAAVFRS